MIKIRKIREAFIEMFFISQNKTKTGVGASQGSLYIGIIRVSLVSLLAFPQAHVIGKSIILITF